MGRRHLKKANTTRIAIRSLACRRITFDYIRIANKSSDKTETTLLKVATHRIGFRPCAPARRPGLRPIHFRTPADELPDVSSKLPNSFCTARNAFALLIVSRSSVDCVRCRLGEQPALGARVEARDLARIETRECLPVRVALSKNRDPAQARLRALERQHLEEPAIVVHRDTPFAIVVANVKRIGSAPGAASWFGHNRKNMATRREFLKTTALAGGAVAFGNRHFRCRFPRRRCAC